MKKLIKRIKIAWIVLTWKHISVHASNADKEYLIKHTIIEEAAKLYYDGKLSFERYQMICSVLFDRSVIVQSMWNIFNKGVVVPAVIYDCESEEDFNELKEQEVE